MRRGIVLELMLKSYTPSTNNKPFSLSDCCHLQRKDCSLQHMYPLCPGLIKASVRGILLFDLGEEASLMPTQ